MSFIIDFKSPINYGVSLLAFSTSQVKFEFLVQRFLILKRKGSFFEHNWHEKMMDTFKAELPRVGILFSAQFSSLGILINKKVGFRKN